MLENESEVNLEVQKPRSEISKTVSEAKMKPVTPLSNNQRYNISSNQERDISSLMSQILDLFPSMSKKKLSKQGFNFKLRGKFRLRNTTKVQEDMEDLTVRKYKLYKDFKEQLKDN